MWPTLLFSVVLATYATATEHNIHNVIETEMFSLPISPNLFNWTYQEFDQQYRFHASMESKPELPPWLRYIYSGRHHSGFIFGTPPRGVKSPIRLQIVGLNRQDYETRKVTVVLKISPKSNMARHEVEFKIDNLNVEDLLDEHKMTRLKDILRMKLWTESSADLYPTFLASAIDLGARLPLRPGDGEGLVVRLGSTHPFSTELKRLREEVRPLSRLPSCPREYKRTTVERLFRDAGLTLDWCQFELYNTIYTDRGTEHLEYLTEIPNRSAKNHNHKHSLVSIRWNAPSKFDLPWRSYSHLMAISIAVPLIMAVLSVASFTVIVCFNYGGIAHNPANVEICRYGTNVTEQTQLGETDSRRSMGPSPNNSLTHPRSHSPIANTNLTADYHRPQPPPYMGGGSLHHRKSGNTEKTPTTSGHTPEHRNLALEESLQLLNEAKISTDFDPIIKDPIIDYADTSEDYVPVQPEISGLNSELDAINVPELSKYGIGAQI